MPAIPLYGIKSMAVFWLRHSLAVVKLTDNTKIDKKSGAPEARHKILLTK